MAALVIGVLIGGGDDGLDNSLGDSVRDGGGATGSPRIAEAQVDAAAESPRIDSGETGAPPTTDALDWTRSYSMRPGRVEEEVAGDGATQPYAWPGADAAQAVRGLVLGQAQAIICADEWACFRQGYRDFGGREEWEEHFVTDVIDQCESYGHGWGDVYPLYISRAQFHPDSWARAARATGLGIASLPYHVGANVAWWSNATDPGGTGGWGGLQDEEGNYLGCWWRGVVPRPPGLDSLKYSK